MTASNKPDTDVLLDRAADGDADARQQLLERHRERLVRMVAIRLDRRVARRLDPSDVVQDAMIAAVKKMDDYIRRRPMPFYPWLRQIAWESLAKCHERHTAGKRAVGREEPPALTDESLAQLVDRLAADGASPSAGLLRSELRDRVRAALASLPQADNEVLVLRYLEQLSTADTADVLGCSPGAVKVRLVRALRRSRCRPTPRRSRLCCAGGSYPIPSVRCATISRWRRATSIPRIPTSTSIRAATLRSKRTSG